jgi:hypothetical protein
MALEYTIYCDESAEEGDYFCDFYGGALVTSEYLDEVKATIAAKKRELNFHGEVKWGKVPGHLHYLQKYIDLINCFFDLVAAGKIKIRIMFRQKTIGHRRLTREHIEQRYFILYYTFIKRGFGLDCSPALSGGVRVRIYPDKIPDTAEQVDRFRSFLAALSKRPEFRQRGIRIYRQDVTDVISHDHDILQCLDIVLGSIHFRLNDLHKQIEKGKRRRARRTRAKEKLYKQINARIRAIYPNFNIGISTGQRTPNARWVDEYRHWRLMPRKQDRVVYPGSKRKKKKKTEAP